MTLKTELEEELTESQVDAWILSAYREGFYLGFQEGKRVVEEVIRRIKKGESEEVIHEEVNKDHREFKISKGLVLG